MATHYNSYDADFNNWLTRITTVGEIPTYNNIAAVSRFVKSLKSQGLWDQLVEIYLFAGVNNFNSIFQKLKYLTTPTITNNGFTSSDYVSSGVNAGLTCGTSKLLNIGLTYTDLDVGNRSVGVYESKTVTGGFFSTIIGRAGGGANSAFGPNIVQTNNNSEFRFLDTTSTTGPPQAANPSVLARGLFACFEGPTSVQGRALNTLSTANRTLGTINGTGGYSIGGALGGGGWAVSTISLGFAGRYINTTDQANLDLIVNTLMTDLGCNVY